MTYLDPALIEGAFTYAAYRQHVTSLLEKGRTTGPDHLQKPDMIAYARLNEQRMDRIDKTFQLEAQVATDLAQINRPMWWLTLTEGWCGDAAQIVPALGGLANANPSVRLRLLLRDEHPVLMDAFLTDGGRSIPKVIFAEADTLRVLGSWGPRPNALQALLNERRATMEALKADKEAYRAAFNDAVTEVHSWYAKDKTSSTQREVINAALAAWRSL